MHHPIANFRKQTAAELRKLGKRGLVNAAGLEILQTALLCAIDGAAEVSGEPDASAAVAAHIDIALETLAPLKVELDTEEREWICDKLAQLANMHHLDIGYKLNVWHYGKKLADKIAKQPKPKILRTIDERCESCGAAFSTDVIAERSDIPPFWVVVKCKQCGHIGIINEPLNAGETRIHGYELIRSHAKSEITREQLQAQLDAARKAGKYPFKKIKK